MSYKLNSKQNTEVLPDAYTNIDDYRKAKREQLLAEVREIQSFKSTVSKRVLYAIVNGAVNSIHS